MERDSITRAGAKGPWGREGEPPEQRHAKARIDLDSVPGLPPPWQRAEGGSKLWDGGGCMPGIGLRSWSCRKALLDMLALKPYRGKPAVRNFRGGDGDVGIIRSPLRAIAPLDRNDRTQRVRKPKRRSSAMRHVPMLVMLASLAATPICAAASYELQW